jgi:signal transduction histidine kinase/ligand-binding sensor domain-containing protein/DNA-binding response OmpR family regulator
LIAGIFYSFSTYKNMLILNTIKKHHCFIRSLIICYLIWITGSLFAQREDLKFVHLSTENGLSNSESNAIIQDKEGFIWIGTLDGLNRYDGRSFKVYRKIAHDSSSLQHNNIKSLFLDSKGTLWIGTDRGGVSRYNKEKDNFTNYLYNPNDSNSLLTNRVTSITEDANHQIWVATYGGLNLFNPEKDNFIHYTDNPLLSISEKGIQKLKKWLPVKSFVNAIESGKGTLESYSNLYHRLEKISKDSVEKFFDLIVIALDDHGVANGDLRTLTADDKGNIWIGYGNGMISSFDPKSRRFIHYKFISPKERGIVDFFISSISVNGDKVWVGTRGEGIWILDIQTSRWRKFDKVTEPFINKIINDKNGNIWIGGTNCGLLCYNPKDNVLAQYKHDEFNRFSISTNTIACIFEDKQQNLWIGGVQSDINFAVKRNPFHSLKQGTTGVGELTYGNVSAFLKEDDNTLWIGFYNVGGIDIINQNTGEKKYLAPNKKSNSGLGEGSVQCIFKDRHSNIWIGSYLGGLQMYDRKNGKLTTYLHKPTDGKTIAGNDVRKITEDKEENLWIAIHGEGVDRFNPTTKEFQHFRVNYSDRQKAIASNWVLTVFCDNDDKIWVGSVEGVSVIDKKNPFIKSYPNDPENDKSKSNNFVLCVFQDSKGNVWLGTSYGLNLFDAKTESFKSFTKNDGLPNDNITGILEDKMGNLWISTFKGLSRYSPKEHTFKNFDVRDGLATDEFLTPTGFMAKNGEMFFSGREGVVSFYPEDVKDNGFVPSVYITDFKLFNQSVKISGFDKKKGFYLDNQITFTKELNLRYSQNVFTFEFVALNYFRPEKNQYAYMMEGFDKQWNNIGSKNDVTYTNLPPGNYTFRVKASNNDGKWNETGTSLKMIITPPWWETVWAYLIYILISFSILWVLRYIILQRERFSRKLELERMEANKIHEVDMMKLRFFTNISHEFRTPLTLILAPLEKPFHLLNPEKLEITYKLIYRNAYRLLRLINQLMDFRKLEGGGLKLEASQNDIIKFVNEIASLFNYEANERNIEFQVISKEESLLVWYDSDKLDKLLYNLVSNAFKFTPDGKKITIYIDAKDVEAQLKFGLKKFIEIIVEDSGIGIQAEELPKIFDRFYQADSTQKNMGSGIGLALTKELTELHHGDIRVESEPNKGTRFILLLPMGKDHLESYQLTEKSNGSDLKTEILHYQEVPDSSIVPEDNGKGGVKKQPVMLIVEDHADLRLFIKHEFMSSYKITEANDGIQGYEMALELIPDMIISDIMMPGMGGIELCKKLKTDERTSHVPIIMLTARSSEEQMVEGLETGADDYMTKPFSVSVLRARVNNLIESRLLLRKQFSKLPDISQVVTTTTLDQKFLERASKIINQHLGDSDFDAHQFASEIGMSRSQLYRKIQALTGYSVNEFIRNNRLKKAAELLIKTDEHNITETAYIVGFKEVTYFVKCFATYYGVSPSKYRVMKRNADNQR